MPVLNDPLQQTINPPIARGEQESVTIGGTFSADPTAWDVRFRIRLTPQDSWTVTVASPTVTVSVTGAYTATWTVPLTAAQTATLDAGLNEFDFWRTDAGSETRISAGVQLVL